MIRLRMKLLCICALLISLIFNTGCGPSEKELRLEQEKAEAAAKAHAKAARLKTINGVLAFLNSQSFYAVFEKPRDSYGIDSSKVVDYQGFEYNEADGTLEFVLYFSHRGGTLSNASGFRSLFRFKAYLSEANPVLSIAYDKSSYRKTECLLSLKCLCQTTEEVTKKVDGNAAYVALALRPPDKAEVDSMGLKPYNPPKIEAIPFYVTEENAPRLKAALEDLLREHGVTPSKY